MENIKIYKRDDNGNIKKLDYIDETGNSKLNTVMHDIVDLIVVGDYVNGYKITSIQEINKYYPKRLLFSEDEENEVMICFNNDDIKTVVTKEKFASVMYQV